VKRFAATTRHGTVNAYHNYGCRCDLCRTAASVHHREGGYQKRYLARLASQGLTSRRTVRRRVQLDGLDPEQRKQVLAFIESLRASAEEVA
jgi:hypothetical protein